MYEVDIFGLTNDGELPVAQVTHTDRQRVVDDKAKRLSGFAGKDRQLIYFGPSSAPPRDTRVKFIPIESVFEQMMKRDSALIHKMLKTDWTKKPT